MNDLPPEKRQAVAFAATRIAETARLRRARYFPGDALKRTLEDIDAWVLNRVTNSNSELLVLRETRPGEAA